MLKNSWTLAVSVAINISLKLCFVSVNGPRERYLLDEPHICDSFKDKVYKMNTHVEEELKENI
jgi:hypothetical protein